MKYIIIFLLLLFSTNTLFAQKDTQFWFAAPEVSSQHGDSPIFMRISALDQPADVRISMPANPGFRTINSRLPANSTVSLDLSAQLSLIENNPPDSVLNKGLYIESSADIFAYYEVANKSNPEIFQLKGNNALGTDFLIPSQYHFKNQVGNETIEIVASQNNTTLTIFPTSSVVGHFGSRSFTVKLNRGQTYSLRAVGTDISTTLSGSRIQADKPVAVTISDDSIFEAGAYDLIGDQIVPVTLAGTEYIVVKGYANKEKVYILALYTNTQIFLDGNTTADITIGAGASFSKDLAGSSLSIKSDKPVLVYHLSGHQNEFGSAILPKINCSGSKQLGFVRTSAQAFALMILVKKGSEGDFTVNGKTNVLGAGAFSEVPGTGGEWLFARQDMSTGLIPVGTNLIQNKTGLFHLGILNSLGGSSEYGYFSDYSGVNLGSDVTKCEQDSVVLDAGSGMDYYLWSDGSKNRTLTVKETGTYRVQVGFSGCALADTVNVTIVKNKPLDLGPDIITCNPIILDAGKFADNFRWQDGSSSPTIKVSKTGMYRVEIENVCGKSADSIYVSFQDLPLADLSNPPAKTHVYQEVKPVLSLTLAGDSSVCENESTALLEATNGFALYEWKKSGEENWTATGRDSSFLAFGIGNWLVRASDPCGNSIVDSLTVTDCCRPMVEIPTAFSPGVSLGVNDIFKIKHLNVKDFRIEIRNRWGQLVFSAEKPESGWDGKIGSEPAPTGVYKVFVQYQGCHLNRPYRRTVQEILHLIN